MASEADREAFIPYRRTDLVELCLEDGQLSAAASQTFRDFCFLLSAYYHFKFQSYLEGFKDNYAPFNPDAVTRTRGQVTPNQRTKKATTLVNDFKIILERANYIPIPLANLQRALEERSIIQLNTKVNFADFDEIVCYYQGIFQQKIQARKLLRKVRKKVSVFKRVVLLIKFKDETHFANQGKEVDELKFTPGKTYLYFYKNVPRHDLELLFPNLKISMTWKDRLLLLVPAIGSAIPIILKVLPKLLIIIGAILFFTVGRSGLDAVGAEEEQVRNVMPVLAATASLVLLLGGFAYKQYSKYKSKQIKFHKNVTDTLFFKNLANNASVFRALVDAAEEEECKEIILVYYHLLTTKSALTPAELDRRIEDWMDRKFDTKINFDINGPINNLEEIRGKVAKDEEEQALKPEVPLLRKDASGNCHVLPLDQAKTLIDYIWDNVFDYT